jgi:hypothetical protein
MALLEPGLFFLIPLILKALQKSGQSRDAQRVMQAIHQAVKKDPIQRAFVDAQADKVNEVVIHWLENGVPPTLSRGVSPGVLRRRTGLASCMLLPVSAARVLSAEYQTLYEAERDRLRRDGMGKSKSATTAHKTTRLAIGARFVTSDGDRIVSVLPGVELLPVIGPNSLISQIGSIALIEAQLPSKGPGPLRELENQWLKEPRKGFRTPRLVVRNRKNQDCMILAFANNGALQYTPVLRSAGLLSMTSKMSAPSFSLPAGTTRAGGSCVSAAIASSDPCQPNICAMCYALSANYAYLTSVLQQSIRLHWVRLTLKQDPSGEQLGTLLAEGIRSFAQFGRGTDRAKQEIGMWTQGGLTRFTAHRATKIRSTSITPKRLLKPVGSPIRVTKSVTADDLLKNKVPGGSMVPGSLSDPSILPKTPAMLREAGRGTPFSFSCESEVQPAAPNAGPVVPVRWKTSTSLLATRSEEGFTSGFFRIHDAGDITIGGGQDAGYQNAWTQAAFLLPAVFFWQPTRAWRAMSRPLKEALLRFSMRPNTALRPSAIEVNSPAPTIPGFAAGSTVNHRVSKGLYAMVTDDAGTACFQCPVYSAVITNAKGELVEAKSCKAAGCRVCWIAPPPVTYGAH